MKSMTFQRAQELDISMNGVTSSCLQGLSQWAMQAAGAQVRLTVNLEWNSIDDPSEVRDLVRPSFKGPAFHLKASLTYRIEGVEFPKDQCISQRSTSEVEVHVLNCVKVAFSGRGS